MTTAESIGLLALLLICSFFLSGLESALLSVSKVRIRHAAKKHIRGASSLFRNLKETDRLLIAILLLNAIANIGAFALFTRHIVDWLGNPWGYIASFTISLPVYVIWVELTPKFIFKKYPQRILILFDPLLRVVRYTICPFLALLAWFPNLILRLFGVKDGLPERGSTREEFRALTNVFQRQGSLEQSEVRLIRRVLDFERVSVKEVMIPLAKTTAVPPDMPISAVLALSEQTKYDQFPVMSSTGDLIGVINIQELLRLPSPSGTVEQYRKTLIKTTPDEYALAIMKRLRNSGQPLAAVYDSPEGIPIGVVSTEDMIQAMVKMS